MTISFVSKLYVLRIFLFLRMIFCCSNCFSHDSVQDFFAKELLGSEEETETLLSYLYAFSEDQYSIIETNEGFLYVADDAVFDSDSIFEQLTAEYVQEGSTIVDYGAENGTRLLSLIHRVGLNGSLIGFESCMETFRELFWNCVLNNVPNAQLFYAFQNEKERTIDSLNLKNVSLMRIDARGRENIVLKGALETIKKYRPVLMIKMIGGIPIEKADKFVKQEFHKRMDEISNMRYVIERVNVSEYIAYPMDL